VHFPGNALNRIIFTYFKDNHCPPQFLCGIVDHSPKTWKGMSNFKPWFPSGIYREFLK